MRSWRPLSVIPFLVSFPSSRFLCCFFVVPHRIRICGAWLCLHRQACVTDMRVARSWAPRYIYLYVAKCLCYRRTEWPDTNSKSLYSFRVVLSSFLCPLDSFRVVLSSFLCPLVGMWIHAWYCLYVTGSPHSLTSIVGLVLASVGIKMPFSVLPIKEHFQLRQPKDWCVQSFEHLLLCNNSTYDVFLPLLALGPRFDR